MSTQISTLATVLLLTLLAAGVVSDVRNHRIPNGICAAVLLLGVITQFASGGWRGLVAVVPGVVVALALFLPFYARRAMGAGDVKLMAAAGAWLGPLGALLGCAMALVAGLVFVVALLLVRTAAQRYPVLAFAPRALPAWSVPVLWVRRDGALKVPYAPAVATGTVLCAWYLDKLGPLLGAAN